MFLDKKQLESLTGYRINSKHREWLDRNGIDYFTRKDGFPNVPKYQFESSTPQEKQPVNEPDFTALSGVV